MTGHYPVTSGSTTLTNVITNLAEGVYNFFVKAVDNLGNEGEESQGTLTVDQTAPTISSVSSTPSTNSASITWTTGENSSSKVDYGLTASYGSNTSETDTSPRVTSHSVTLSSVLPCVTYHYRVRSKDAANNEKVDSDRTFTTSGCTGDASVLAQSSSDITSSSGGSLSLLTSGNGLTLTVPSSFSGSDANFQIKKLDAQTALITTQTPSGYALVGSYLYDLHALSGVSTAITSFDHPVTVTFAYADADLTGLDEDSLVIYRYDSGAWTILTGCTINKSTNTIFCQTSHFSVFALFAKELVTQANNISSGSSSNSSSSPSTFTCTAAAPSFGPTFTILTLSKTAPPSILSLPVPLSPPIPSITAPLPPRNNTRLPLIREQQPGL